MKERAELVERRDELASCDRDNEQRTQVISSSQEALTAALLNTNQPEGPPSESLADRLERASTLIKDVEERRTSRKAWIKAQERTRRERAEAELRLQEMSGQLEQWRSEWSARMARLGLEANATPAQADSFLNRIDKLFGHLKEVRTFRIRIEGIDRDAQRFADDVKTLAQAIAPDLADRAPEVAVPELYQRLAAARDLRKERDTLISNRDAAAGKLQSARETIAHDRARLELLCKEARCKSPDDLAEAEAAAAERARLEAERDRVEDQIPELQRRRFARRLHRRRRDPSIPTPSN